MDKTNSLIKDIQIEITNSNPNYKYTDYYRLVELEYWSEIPKMIEELNDINPIKSCLDIGVAMGTLLLFTHKLSGCTLYATEILKHLSDDIIAKYNIEFKVLNVELQKIAFSKKKFDCIIMTEILEHFKFSPVSIMTKVKNLLTPNGSLFLSTPNVVVWGKLDKYKSWKEIPEPPIEFIELEDLGHEYHYSLSEIEEILDLAGLKIVKSDFSPKGSQKHFNFEIKRR